MFRKNRLIDTSNLSFHYSPHPYGTNWEDGPNAGASTFLSSPHYLSRIDQNYISLPKWKSFDDEHPVDQYAIITKNCTGDFAKGEIMAVRKRGIELLLSFCSNNLKIT